MFRMKEEPSEEKKIVHCSHTRQTLKCQHIQCVQDNKLKTFCFSIFCVCLCPIDSNFLTIFYLDLILLLFFFPFLWKRLLNNGMAFVCFFCFFRTKSIDCIFCLFWQIPWNRLNMPFDHSSSITTNLRLNSDKLFQTFLICSILLLFFFLSLLFIFQYLSHFPLIFNVYVLYTWMFHPLLFLFLFRSLRKKKWLEQSTAHQQLAKR